MKFYYFLIEFLHLHGHFEVAVAAKAGIIFAKRLASIFDFLFRLFLSQKQMYPLHGQRVDEMNV